MRFQTNFALTALAGLTAASAAADTLDKIFKADVCELIKPEKELNLKTPEEEVATYNKDLEM
ncbi:hypothetical protein MCOR25_001964 [Pyricularia grisea]|uniref:Uncharacterized protein n=1 Tax=Pyricularia grisea TaxID=148305 RepID=A0A6P8APK3_PYRGI|nr:hypothetical protein PgNI_11135 [Pyricularia grisea]KAI6379375.1 hypothetical protein MCOR25_001964 [Pyricularia grisea]TLD03960.1 hypothetical protein PgNI_11135 [Pyricularia grisea]